MSNAQRTAKMKSACQRLMVSVAIVLSAAAAVVAQTPGPVGQWACQFAYTELDQFGNRKSGFVEEYMIAVHANGSFEAQGMTAAANGYNQFQSQGQWQQTQGQGFMAQGDAHRTSGLSQPFMIVATLAPDGMTMMNSYEQPDPSGRYAMNRSNTYCERR